MAKKMNRNDYMKELGKKLIDKVLGEKGIAYLWENPVQVPLIHPFNPVTKTIYSGVNEWLLMLASYERMGDGYVDPRFYTAKQAIEKKIWPAERNEDGSYKTNEKGFPITKKDEHGVSVMKDKGYPVFFFKKYVNKKDMARIMGDTTLSEAERKAEMLKAGHMVAKLYYVYNATDLEVEPMKKETLGLLQWSDKIRNKLLDNGIKNSEAKIKYDAVSANKGINCYVGGMFDTIHLCRKNMFRSADAFYDTAYHEMAHSTGHDSRLKRDMNGKKGSPQYAREELVAELTATFFRLEFGGEVSERTMKNHEAYLDSWIHLVKDKPENFLAIISDAVKAYNYIKDNMVFKGMSEYEKEKAIRLYVTGGKADHEKAKKDEGKELVKKHTKKSKKDDGMDNLFAA